MMLAIRSLIFFLCLHLVISSPLQHKSWSIHPRGLVPRTDGSTQPRDVYVQLTSDWGPDASSSLSDQLAQLDAQDIRSAIHHASLEIQGDGISNGNIRMEVEAGGPNGFSYIVEVNDYGLGNPMDPPPTRFAGGKFIKSFKIGSVSISNQALVDSSSGKGLVADVWSSNTQYSTISNNCIRFVSNMVDKLGLTPPPDVAQFFTDSKNAFFSITRYRTLAVSDVPVQLITRPDSTNPAIKESSLFDVEDSGNPKLLQHTDPSADTEGIQYPSSDITGTLGDTQQPLESWDQARTFFDNDMPAEADYFSDEFQSPFGDGPPTDGEDFNEGAIGEEDAGSDSCSKRRKRSDGLFVRSTCTSSTGPKELAISGSSEIAVVRNAGFFQMVASFGESSLETIGVGAAIVGALFIILDLVDGQFQAAAFGAAGLVAGLAAGLYLSGPLGLFIGAAVGALFALLPGLFGSSNEPGQTNNSTQIIQYVFFGNREHTGNEECNKQRAAANPPQSQNCTAVYGAGVLSKVFNWDIFDSIVFLIENNQGLAMSIIDIAKAFPVKDYSVDNWGSNVTSYIDCGPRTLPKPNPHSPPLTPSQTKYDSSPASGYECGDAKFIVNRTLIQLPSLNATASQIYSRIIPAPGGDCKLLSDPTEGIYLSFLDLTITGRPVGIACNLTINNTEGLDPALNFFGVNPSNATSSTTYSNGSTILLYNPTTNTTTNYTLPTTNSSLSGNYSLNSTGVSPVVSTDGSTSRAYEPPPPPSLFQTYNASNALCITSPTGTLCLPNGTYDTSNGTLGFNTKSASALSLPFASYLIFSLPSIEVQAAKNQPTTEGSIGDEQYNTTLSFGQNITSGSSKDFTDEVTILASSGGTFNAIVPHSPPGLCLHASMNFMGDVQCFGLGGGNITGPIVHSALSLSFRGNATAWIYAEYYGDLGGTFVSTDIGDMTELPYGTDGNFARNVKALWISLPE